MEMENKQKSNREVNIKRISKGQTNLKKGKNIRKQILDQNELESRKKFKSSKEVKSLKKSKI